MNIPTNSIEGPAASTGYQALYSARAGKSTFEQTLAQTQSSSFSLTTAEGDQVTLSSLSQNYQYTQAIGWFNPASSGVQYARSSTSAQAMGISVQGDLNAQELADITRLVGELTSIASTFFSDDYESAMIKAMDFGDIPMGSVSALSATFSRQTVSQTRITSHSPLPAMADLKDISDTLGTNTSGERDYATVLEARWQQILKALDEMKANELDGLFARRMAPKPLPVTGMPPEEHAARQMVSHMEQLLSDHPKLTPFAKALGATAMDTAARHTEQGLPDTARALGDLKTAFLNQLHQWFLPPEPPTASGAGLAV